MIEINNFTKSKINKNFVEKVAKYILEKENKKNKFFSLAFVGEKRMRKINKEFLGKNKSTDVLSFSEIGSNDKNNLGEIVICLQKTENPTQALIHGILHLLGYDHEKSDDMQKKEIKYLSNFKNLLVEK